EYQQAELQASDHACIVVDVFAQLSSDCGTVKSYGVVITSPYMLRNMAVDTQGSDVLAVTNGTYKIHFGIDVVIRADLKTCGWTLIDFGSHIPSYSRRRYRRTFKPWMYMFVQTENADAFKRMFSTAIKCAQTFFGRTLLPRSFVHHFGSLPSNLTGHHSAELLSPPSSECSVEEGQAPSSRLHTARSRAQFLAQAALVTAFWRSEGEHEFADWFTDTYLTSPWENWFATVAIPGILPNQNSIESHHRAIKQICVDHLRADTATVLNDSIPSVIRYQALKRGMTAQTAKFLLLGPKKAVHQSHAMEGMTVATNNMNIYDTYEHDLAGPLCSMIVSKTRILCNTQNQAIIKRHRLGFYFNVPKYTVRHGNNQGLEVTLKRVSTYSNSLIGYLDATRDVDIPLSYLALHEVRGKRRERIAISLAPSIALETRDFNLPSAKRWHRRQSNPRPTAWRCRSLPTELFKEKYHCDGKCFHATGWQCAHVVAAMFKAKALAMETAYALLPVRKVGGGQRNIPSALSKDTLSGQDSPYHLITSFLELPATPMHWNIMRAFDDVYKPGQVICWKERTCGRSHSTLERYSTSIVKIWRTASVMPTHSAWL
ncbi:TPA: hypothetical protein N0F65_005046, partial [Lagenidium giganteum]